MSEVPRPEIKIETPDYPPDPVDGSFHIYRMGASLVANPFRNVDSEETLRDFRSVLNLTISSS